MDASDNEIATSEHLLSGLKYDSPAQSNVVLGRSTQRINPLGSAAYSNTSRNLVIRMQSSQYIDPQSAVLHMCVKGANSQCVLDDPGLLSLIKEVRVSVAGVLVEHHRFCAESLRPILYATASKDWMASAGSQMGSWLWTRSLGCASQVEAGTFKSAGFSGTDKMNTHTTIGWTEFANSFPWNEIYASNSTLNRQGTEVDGEARYLSMPLHLISGLFRSQRWLPARNMGAIQLEITLAPYAEAFVQVGATALTDGAAPVWHDGAIATQSKSMEEYSVTQVSVTYDVLQLAPSYTDLVDNMCRGSTGISLLLDTYSTQQQPVSRSDTTLAISTSRGFSHLLDVFACFMPSKLSKSAFYPKSMGYLMGSVFESYQLTIGSNLYPVCSVNGSGEAWTELQKALNRHNQVTKGSCIDWRAYQCRTPSTAAGKAARGLFPSIADITSTAADATPHDHCAPHLMANSTFLIGQSVSRLLNSEGSLSGLNSRLSGYTCQMNINIAPYTDHGKVSYDEMLEGGSQNDLNALLTTHSNVLLSIRNDAVSISD